MIASATHRPLPVPWRLPIPEVRTACYVFPWWLARFPPILTTSLLDCTQGRFDKAESYSGRALAIARKTLGSDHPDYPRRLKMHRALVEKLVS